jgi:hypothetical protein
LTEKEIDVGEELVKPCENIFDFERLAVLLDAKVQISRLVRVVRQVAGTGAQMSQFVAKKQQPRKPCSTAYCLFKSVGEVASDCIDVSEERASGVFESLGSPLVDRAEHLRNAVDARVKLYNGRFDDRSDFVGPVGRSETLSVELIAIEPKTGSELRGKTAERARFIEMLPNPR